MRCWPGSGLAGRWHQPPYPDVTDHHALRSEPLQRMLCGHLRLATNTLERDNRMRDDPTICDLVMCVKDGAGSNQTALKAGSCAGQTYSPSWTRPEIGARKKAGGATTWAENALARAAMSRDAECVHSHRGRNRLIPGMPDGGMLSGEPSGFLLSMLGFLRVQGALAQGSHQRGRLTTAASPCSGWAIC
jgi:hypothetical protein